jgi:hypothetical protein
MEIVSPGDAAIVRSTIVSAGAGAASRCAVAAVGSTNIRATAGAQRTYGMLFVL